MPSPLVASANKVVKYYNSGVSVPPKVLGAARRIQRQAGTQEDMDLVLTYIGAVQTGSSGVKKATAQAGGLINRANRYVQTAFFVGQGGATGLSATVSLPTMVSEDFNKAVSSQTFKNAAENLGLAFGAPQVGRQVANKLAAGGRVLSTSLSVIGTGAALAAGIVNGINAYSGFNSAATQREVNRSARETLLDPDATSTDKSLARADWLYNTTMNRGLPALLGPVGGDWAARRELGLTTQYYVGRSLAGIERSLRDVGRGDDARAMHQYAESRYYEKMGTFGLAAEAWDSLVGPSRGREEAVMAEAKGLVDRGQALLKLGFEEVEKGQFGRAADHLTEAMEEGVPVPAELIANPANALPGILAKRENQANYALSQMASHGREWE